MERQKGVLDREIEGLLQYTNKMDDKNVYISFGFLNERFTLGLNKIEKLKKIPFQLLHSRKTHVCSVMKALVFGYGNTIKLLLTN